MQDTARPAPPRLHATRAAVVAGCGLVLCLVSLIFDAAPLFVPAVGLLALGVGTPTWVWLAAKGAAAERQLPAERVIEDEPVDATIEVRRGRLGLPGAEVVDPFTGSRFELSGELSPVKGDRTTNVKVRSRFPRRGLHRLPAAVAHRPRPAGSDPRRGGGPDGQPAGPRAAANRAGPVAGRRPQPPAAPARRSRRLRGAGGRRPRRAAPVPPWNARQPDPLAGGGARRRADRAPAAGRRRHPPARRARRPDAGLRRGRRRWSCSTPPCARRRRSCSSSAAPEAAACCCRASSARR